ncbi:uncharacterized protein [Nicotiana sylvestris]|uniref:Uncharacterized protein LOC104249261 n=1 Tax=Nicotiana sylvestris TaxID=4096 RepID=A0A1U7YLG0_NICSY|nr:PREDICTED: uncharacterized protein LOC104249261 [Nicotiana sylvestris]
MAEDSELWDVICDGPFIPTKTSGDPVVTVLETRKEFNDADRKAIEKNFRAKKRIFVQRKLLFVALVLMSTTRFQHINPLRRSGKLSKQLMKGTTQAKQSKIEMLTTEYGLFRIKEDESIQDMYTRFISIINELHSQRKIIPRNKLVRKILSVLPGSWETRVNAITEAKDL